VLALLTLLGTTAPAHAATPTQTQPKGASATPSTPVVSGGAGIAVPTTPTATTPALSTTAATPTTPPPAATTPATSAPATTTPPAATTPPASTTPLFTPTTPTPATGATGATGAHPQTNPSSGGSTLSTGAIVAAVLAGLIALACVFWGVARMYAYEPRWTLALRHAMAEAGFRASNTWSELTDWAKLGR
jgi:hypothetical protein